MIIQIFLSLIKKEYQVHYSGLLCKAKKEDKIIVKLHAYYRRMIPSDFIPPIVHRGAFCQFPFRLINYCQSNISTGKETVKMHLCVVNQYIMPRKAFFIIATLLMPLLGNVVSCPTLTKNLELTLDQRCSSSGPASFRSIVLSTSQQSTRIVCSTTRVEQHSSIVEREREQKLRGSPSYYTTTLLLSLSLSNT